MTKEEYKILNNYYNDLCLGLSVNDSFYLNNLPKFGEIAFNELGVNVSTQEFELKAIDSLHKFIEDYKIYRNNNERSIL